MKGCLNSGFPFVVGILVYSSFETNKVASTGMVPMPGPKESLLGGYWYVDTRNSWGTRWGDRGYFYIPYDYLLSTSLSSDLWSIDFV